MAKKKNVIANPKIWETILSLVKWYRYDRNGNIKEEVSEKPENEEKFEFSYSDFLEEEFGINISQGQVDIDMREMMNALKKYEHIINDTKYEKVEINIMLDRDGYFENAVITGRREQTDAEILKKEKDKIKEAEEKKAMGEKKKKEREERKLEKLRAEMEKYKDKL